MQNSPFLFCSVPFSACGGFKEPHSQLAAQAGPGFPTRCPFSPLLVGWKLHRSEWQLCMWRRWARVQVVGRGLAPLGRGCTQRPNAFAEEKHEREVCARRGWNWGRPAERRGCCRQVWVPEREGLSEVRSQRPPFLHIFVCLPFPLTDVAAALVIMMSQISRSNPAHCRPRTHALRVWAKAHQLIPKVHWHQCSRRWKIVARIIFPNSHDSSVIVCIENICNNSWSGYSIALHQALVHNIYSNQSISLQGSYCDPHSRDENTGAQSHSDFPKTMCLWSRAARTWVKVCLALKPAPLLPYPPIPQTMFCWTQSAPSHLFFLCPTLSFVCSYSPASKQVCKKSSV